MPSRGSPNGARHIRPQPDRPGRDRPEQVVVIDWNAWSSSIGIGGRHHPVRAALLVCLAVFPPVTLSGALQRHRQDPSAGASTPFVHPALTAPEAPIHWLTDPGTALLDAMAKRPPPGAPADFVLAHQPCIQHVVIGPGDVEQLLIRTSQRSLTIRLTGHRASRAPVCLRFVVSPQSRVKETAAILASYPDLLTMRPRWVKKTSQQILARDAFIAFDGRFSGASHREVAEVIYGLRRVREQWSGRGGWMKEHMRRALAKGQALCNGGHWRLVEQACRFRS